MTARRLRACLGQGGDLGSHRRHDNCSAIVCPRGFPFRPYLGPELLYIYYFHKANFPATVTADTIFYNAINLISALPLPQLRRRWRQRQWRRWWRRRWIPLYLPFITIYIYGIYLLYISPTTTPVVFTMIRTMSRSRSFSLSLSLYIYLYYILDNARVPFGWKIIVARSWTNEPNQLAVV